MAERCGLISSRRACAARDRAGGRSDTWRLPILGPTVAKDGDSAPSPGPLDGCDPIPLRPHRFQRGTFPIDCRLLQRREASVVAITQNVARTISAQPRAECCIA